MNSYLCWSSSYGDKHEYVLFGYHIGNVRTNRISIHSFCVGTILGEEKLVEFNII